MNFTYNRKFIKPNSIKISRKFCWLPTCLAVKKDFVTGIETQAYYWLQYIYAVESIKYNFVLTSWYPSIQSAIQSLDEYVFDGPSIYDYEARLSTLLPDNLVEPTYGAFDIYVLEYNKMLEKFNKLKETHHDY